MIQPELFSIRLQTSVMTETNDRVTYFVDIEKNYHLESPKLKLFDKNPNIFNDFATNDLVLFFDRVYQLEQFYNLPKTDLTFVYDEKLTRGLVTKEMYNEAMEDVMIANE